MTSLIYIVIFIAVVIGILLLYAIYCSIGLFLFSRKVKRGTGINKKAVLYKFNIAVYLARLHFYKLRKRGTSKQKASAKTQARIRLMNYILTSIEGFEIGALVSCIKMIIVLYVLSIALNAVAAMSTTIFGKDDECTCYLKCRHEAEYKFEYEELFGVNELENFYDALNKDKGGIGDTAKKLIKDNNYEGAAGTILSDMGNNCLEVFKKAINKNSGVKERLKGKDDNELMQALRDIISSNRKSGVNINCKVCNESSLDRLDKNCKGAEPYREPFEFEEDAFDEEDGDKDESGDEDGVVVGYLPGQATGNYSLKLKDGTYYWYHQSGSCKCKYIAKNKVYGSISDVKAGGTSYNGMSARGCGIYSTATALSNLLGEEITPFEVITDVMKCKIKKDSNGAYYFESYANNGIIYSQGMPDMKMDILAELINKAYGNKGIKAKVINFNKASVDAALTDSNAYSYIINSYGTNGIAMPDFPWYKGNGHFFVLRGKEGDKYKMFTSAAAREGSSDAALAKAMDTYVGWDAINKYKRHSTALVISRNKNKYVTAISSKKSIGYSKAIYNAISKSGYSSRAWEISIVFPFLKGLGFSDNFAYAEMGNIANEGRFGSIEQEYGKWTGVSDAVRALSGKIITSEKQVDTLLTISPERDAKYKGGGIGVGYVQWSFGRRKSILDRYKKYVKVYDVESENKKIKQIAIMQRAKTETDFMEAEFNQKKYGASSSFTDKNNLTMAELVKAYGKNDIKGLTKIIIKEFEKCGSQEEELVERSDDAKAIKKIIESIPKDERDTLTLLGAIENTSNNNNNLVVNNTTDIKNTESLRRTEDQVIVKSNKNLPTKKVGSKKVNGLTVVNIATKYATKKYHAPYVFGGNSLTTGIDCSHFIHKIYQLAGINYGYRTSGALQSIGMKVEFNSPADIDNLNPGDILCYNGHVAIYMDNKGESNGKKNLPRFIHASNKKEGVKITLSVDGTLSSGGKAVVAVRRLIY